MIYKVVESQAVCSLVETGPSSLTETLVKTGIEIGDEIVIGPYKALEKIRQGDRVVGVTGPIVAEKSDRDESGMEIEVR